ncbi:MAG: hypothetical protein AAGA48_23870 [Myxococcota bacterium]
MRLATLFCVAACSNAGVPHDAPVEVAGWANRASTTGVLPFNDTELDTYFLDISFTDPSVLVRELGNEEFVAVNLLVFKEDSGLDGLSGREAYAVYTSMNVTTQQDLGSRSILNADIEVQAVGSSSPEFQALRLIEYDNRADFGTFSVTIPDEGRDARAAGLVGQWLLPAHTLSEDRRPRGRNVDCGSWTPQSAAEATGLSLHQAQDILDQPSTEPVLIFELIAIGSATGDFDAYSDALALVQDELGARRRWEGELIRPLIGDADPTFEQARVTDYPSPDCAIATLADPRVTRQDTNRVTGSEVYWLYAATRTPRSF